MSFIPGISNAIASIGVHPIAQKVFLETSKEGPKALLPTEASVLVGRSIQETQRSGFLGFQERFTEELLAAYIWLFGVNHMQKLFDAKIAPHFFKDAAHLSGKTAWNFPWRKAADVDLTPMQKYTLDARDARQLLRLKSSRWFFSVGLAIALAAYIIPKLNQLKTNLILKYFYDKYKNPNQANPSTLHPTPNAAPDASIHASKPIPHQTIPSSTLTVPGLRPVGIATTGHAPTSGLVNGLIPGTAFSQAGTNSSLSGIASSSLPGITVLPPTAAPMAGTVPPRFGSLFTTVVEKLGRAVDHTDYGSILVVDTGITGGRAAVARSPFEAVEVIFRDVVSLFFYILAIPLVMRAVAKVLDPLFNTSLQIEPKVASEINRLTAESDGNPKRLREILEGSSCRKLLDTISPLQARMRGTAFNPEAKTAFHSLLENETAVYLRDSQNRSAAVQAVVEHLTARTADNRLDTRDIRALTTAIMDGKGKFAVLSKTERQDLDKAVRQAFRHTVGIRLDDAVNLMRGILHDKAVPAREMQDLERRLTKVAYMDGLDQANTMLRRSLNISWGHLKQDDLLKHGERIAGLTDRATNLRVGFDKVFEGELDELKVLLKKARAADEFVKLISAPDRLDTLTVGKLKVMATRLEQLAQTRKDGLKKQRLKDALEKVRALQAFTEGADSTTNLRRLTAPEYANRRLSGLVDMLHRGLKADAPAPVAELLAHYTEAMPELLDSGGRLFSLFLDDAHPEAVRKSRDVVLGGLYNDNAFLRRMLATVDHFTPNSWLYNNPKKAVNMAQSIESYGEKLINMAESYTGNGSERLAQGMKSMTWPEVTGKFLHLNRNLNYGTRLLSLGVAMLGLGWLVPKLQYALTRQLTGKNENPGIGSALKAHGNLSAGKQSAGWPQDNPAPLPAFRNGPALNRHGFKAFQASQ